MTNSQSQSQYISNNIDYFSLLRHQIVGAVLSKFLFGDVFWKGERGYSPPCPFLLGCLCDLLEILVLNNVP